jgi:hypothetical protein
MWSRLDDGLADHPKIYAAGTAIGKNGGAIAIGMFAMGLIWVNRHLTNGHLPTAVVEGFPHVARPLFVAAALVDAGLWERAADGFCIHDYNAWNPAPTAAIANRDRAANKRTHRAKTGARARWARRHK